MARSPRIAVPPGPARAFWLTAGVLATLVLTAVLTLLYDGQAPATPGHRPPRKPAASAPATSPPHPLDVVGIGDSVTAGAGCDCATFVERYASTLTRQGTPADPVNLGRSGWTSTQLVQALEQPGPLRDAAASADVLLVTIGANDLQPLKDRFAEEGCTARCYTPAVSAVGANIRRIVDDVRRARNGRPTTVLVTDYWNVFKDGDVAAGQRSADFLAWSDELTRAVNAQICAGATEAGATCVDLYAPFKDDDGGKDPTPLLADDGDHPDSAGHAVIARALLAVGRPLLPR